MSVHTTLRSPMFAWWLCSITGAALILAAGLAVAGQTAGPIKRPPLVPGRRGVVIDERLSALRTRPDLKAPVIQRLRRGRMVGILGLARGGPGGLRFHRVAVTRHTRGWILAEALVRPSRAEDAARLMRLLKESKDDFARARLARLYVDQFGQTAAAPEALLALGQAGEHAAERLSREAKRRVGDEDSDAGLTRRDYLLNYAGLDRYNRAGVTFDYDEAGERIVYDGGAYRELLRRYPRSAAAQEARQSLAKLGKD